MDKNLKIPLSDLATIRLLCRADGCGGVAELPTRRLWALTGEIHCPSCSRQISTKSKVGELPALKALGMVLQSLDEHQDNVMIEFVVPYFDQ